MNVSLTKLGPLLSTLFRFFFFASPENLSWPTYIQPPGTFCVDDWIVFSWVTWSFFLSCFILFRGPHLVMFKDYPPHPMLFWEEIVPCLGDHIGRGGGGIQPRSVLVSRVQGKRPTAALWFWPLFLSFLL